uniref:Interleukin-3 n=1 Tax=Molossus molossus TaxID=27622 RepID=A0A7J8I741_MOLMO|nr:interleukin 3 [Molossus molossus]
MHLARPRISSLPVLHLVLLLLAHHITQAQGMNLPYLNYIKEIEKILEEPVPLQNDLNSHEKFVLRNEIFLKVNLDTFLEAAKNLTDRRKKIGENLEKFKAVLPNATSTKHQIYIMEGNWDDFRRKLKAYMQALKRFIGF